eukprot:15207921-Alexandrium_andersonii.AAC.1
MNSRCATAGKRFTKLHASLWPRRGPRSATKRCATASSARSAPWRASSRGVRPGCGGARRRAPARCPAAVRGS